MQLGSMEDNHECVCVSVSVLCCVCSRNPEPQLRPSFDAVFRVLRRPEGELIHWSEDMAAGRHLLRGSNTTHSFSDLQNKYT